MAHNARQLVAKLTNVTVVFAEIGTFAGTVLRPVWLMENSGKVIFNTPMDLGSQGGGQN